MVPSARYKFHELSSTGPRNSLAAHCARRHVIATRQIIQSVEFRLCFVHALPKDFNSGLGSDAYAIFNEIYAARCIPQALGIFKRLLVCVELGLSALEFIAKLRRLPCIPSRILGVDLRLRYRW